MTYCLNPNCPKPENLEENKFCISCGSKLKVGDYAWAIQSISETGGGRTFLGKEQQSSQHPQKCIIKQISLVSRKADPLLEFRKEAEKLLELGKHPQIPELLAYIEADPNIHNFSPVVIQQLISGTSIEQEQFEENSIRQLLNEILPLLQFVHDQGIIHRDLNPQNIIRTTEGRLFLVDFSTAKVTTKTALAKTGTVIGSAAYSSPEQLRGKATYASDLYSLGVICIYLLTRIHPFDLFSSLEGVWAWKDYLTIPITQQLEDILNKLLAEGLSDRYDSASQVYEDLNQGQTIIPTVTPSKSASQGSKFVKVLKPHWQCFKTLTGHSSSIHTLVFHPDAPLLASASADRTIRCWDLDKHRCTQVLEGHRGIIESLLFHPDKTQKISCSWDYTIRFWDQEETQRWEGHSGWINALAVSPDGKRLASGSADQTIKLWDLATGEAIATLTGHHGPVECLAFSPDGKILVSGSGDKTVKLWDIEQQSELHTLEGHTEEVNAVVLSPSGQMVFSGSADTTIKLWQVQTGQLLKNWQDHEDIINSLAISSQGNMLISGSSDQTAKIWHPATGQVLHTLRGHTSGIITVDISPTNTIIATGSQDKTIKLWEFR